MFSGIRSFQEESWQPCLAHAVRLMVVLNTIPAAEMLTLGKKVARRTIVYVYCDMDTTYCRPNKRWT